MGVATRRRRKRRLGALPLMKLRACQALLKVVEDVGEKELSYRDMVEIMMRDSGVSIFYAMNIIRGLAFLGVIEKSRYGFYKVSRDKLSEHVRRLEAELRRRMGEG